MSIIRNCLKRNNVIDKYFVYENKPTTKCRLIQVTSLLPSNELNLKISHNYTVKNTNLKFGFKYKKYVTYLTVYTHTNKSTFKIQSNYSTYNTHTNDLHREG